VTGALTADYYQLTAPGQLRLVQERHAIDQLGPTSILARTLRSVISTGTELAAWRGDPPLRPGAIYPRLVGYCNVAEVVALGEGLTHLRAGDRILTHQSHRSAFVCEGRDVLATVPSGVDSTAAAATYLFHLGYAAMLRADVVSGKRVCVIGAGVVGRAAALCSAALGNDTTLVTAQAIEGGDAGRLRAVGRDEVSAAVFDLVLNTTNLWPDHRLSMELARRGGTISVLGFPGRSAPIPDFNPFESRLFYDKQLTIMAAGHLAIDDHRHTLLSTCGYLLSLIESGLLDATSLIGGTMPWRDLSRAYQTLDTRQPGVVTYALDWSEQ